MLGPRKERRAHGGNKVLKWQLAVHTLLMPRALQPGKVNMFVAPNYTFQISAWNLNQKQVFTQTLEKSSQDVSISTLKALLY